MHTESWHLQLTSRPALCAGGDRHGLSRKDAALFALVALEGPQAAAPLCSLLWPQANERAALSSLRQRLFRLRKLTGARLLQAETRITVASDLAPYAFPALDSLADDASEWLAPWLANDAYADLPELAPRIAAQSQVWAQHQRDALARRAAEAEAAGDLPRALALAQRLLQRDALDETAHRRVIRLHYLRGDRAAALAAYEHCQHELGEQLGLRPSRETTALIDALAQAHARPAPTRTELPPGLLKPPQMVARQRELAALLGGLASERVMVLTGEAGIGKSRLIAEALRGAPGSVAAAARPTDAGVALSTLARLLRALLAAYPQAVDVADRPELARALPELGPAAPGSGESQRLLMLRAIERSLARAHAQGLQGLVLDDLHYADTASALTLLALIECELLAPLRWLLARRPDASTGGDRLCAALFETGRAEALPLPALNAECLRDFIVSLDLPQLSHPALPEALLRHTGGNPLFALETLRHLHTAGSGFVAGAALPSPGSVAQLIGLRLRSLSAPAQDLARVLAIADTAFSVALAESVLEVHTVRLTDSWAELESAQILRGERYAHDLVAEAVRAGIPQAIAARLHHRVASFLVQAGVIDARVAVHWERAGDMHRALPAYRQAAAQARASWQVAVEAELLRKAIVCAQQVGNASAAFDAHAALCDATRQGQSLAQAQALAQELFESAADAVQRARALLLQGELALDAQDMPAALRCVQAAADLALASGDRALVFKAACVEAQALAQSGRVAEAGQRLADADLCHLTTPTNEDWLRYHGTNGQVAYCAGDAAVAADAYTALCALARSDGELIHLHRGLSNLSMSVLLLGLAEPALQHAREAAELSQRLGLGAMQRTVDQINVGMTSLAAARYADAIEVLEACSGSTHAPAVWQEHGRTLLGIAWLHLGQMARAQQMLVEPPADLPLPGVMRAARAVAQLEAARQQGPLTAAQTALVEAVVQPSGHAMLIGLVTLRNAQLQGPAAVRALLTECPAAEKSAQTSIPVSLRLVQAVGLADALVALNQHAEAARLARDTAAQLEPFGFAYLYKPALMPDIASCLHAVGEQETADKLLQAAKAWVLNVAENHVPEPFKDAFLRRHPINRRVLA